MVDCNYNVEAVVGILKRIKEVLPMTEDAYSLEESKFICDNLFRLTHEASEQREFYTVEREVKIIEDRIDAELDGAFSYAEKMLGRQHTFEEGQRVRQEFLRTMIAEFETEMPVLQEG